MKLTNKWEISEWAYHQCLNGNDTEEMRDLITEEAHIYSYCKKIEDRTDMWPRINSWFYAISYCRHVKYRRELAKLYSQVYD